MDSSKTRIWRGGLAAITQGRGHEEPKPLAGELHATRILPIERLLPAQASQSSEPDTERIARSIPRPRRRWPLVLAGVFTLCVVLSLQVLQLRRRLSEQHAVAPRASEPNVVAPAKVAAPSAAALAQPKPAPRSKALNPVDRSRLERAAVDSVIAGDYARASRMYRELWEIDSNPVFAAAARVLEARKSAP